MEYLTMAASRRKLIHVLYSGELEDQLNVPYMVHFMTTTGLLSATVPTLIFSSTNFSKYTPYSRRIRTAPVRRDHLPC